MLIQKLQELAGNGNGNLYEGHNAGDGEIQRAFIQKAIETYNPAIIFETGTNKAFFGAFLAELGFSGSYITCDPDYTTSQPCIDLLKESVSFSVKYFPFPSNSPEFVKEVSKTKKLKMAWVDGMHSTEGCLFDLNLFATQKCPILVDDYNIDQVKKAIATFLSANDAYKLVEISQDFRQIALLAPTV